MKKFSKILIVLFLVFIVLSVINLYREKNKYKSIKIVYDYDNLVFADQKIKGEKLEINVSGETLKELQNLIQKYNIENPKNKQNGKLIILMHGDYQINFYDGSRMIIDYDSYDVQYKNDGNYFNLYNAQEISEFVKELVDNELNSKEKNTIDTDKITITPVSSNKSMIITDNNLISQVCNEFKYVKSDLSKKDVTELEKHYINQSNFGDGETFKFEIKYTVNFNNGTIIQIYPSSGTIACIVDNNGNIKEIIQIYGKFINMIDNLYTDELRSTNKLFKSEEIYISYNGIRKKISNVDKEYILNELMKLHFSGIGYKNYKIDNDSKDYILLINNNSIIIDYSEDAVYSICENERIKEIQMPENLKNYIKKLVN